GVGFAAKGAKVFEATPGKGVEAMVRCGDGALVRDRTDGWFRLARDPWRVEPLPSPRLASATRLFAPGMDRLLEFRYDQKEIASLDAMAGKLLWRRALDEAP